MKKKLLVTLGDSFTEGVGCYDLERNPSMIKYNAMEDEDRLYQIQRFHELGWPNRVGRSLGFDKVANLGLGGTSNSFSVKMLMERVVGNDRYKDYEIYVIWMATEPARFSFFDGYKLRSFLPTTREGGTLSEAYLRTLKEPDLGSFNEQVFYTKLAEQICENNGYKLIICHWSITLKHLYRLYDSKYFLNKPPSLLLRAALNDEYDLSPICNHPNEFGYKKISKVMLDLIKTNRPEFVVGPSKDFIEWEWNGGRSFPEKDFPSKSNI